MSKILKIGTFAIPKIGSDIMGYSNPIKKYGAWAWYNNDITTMTVDGGNRVSEWRDSSGNSRHLTQVNAGNRPIYTTGLLSGQGGVYFDGASTPKFLSRTFGFNLTGVVDVFFVGRMLTSSTFPYYFGGSDATNAIIHYWFSNQFRLVTLVSSVNSNQICKTTQTLPTPYQLMNPTFDGTSSQYRENGSLLTSSLALGNPQISGITLGSGPNGTDVQTRLNGDILEFAIFNYKLNSTQRAIVNGYFLAKYGL